MAQLLIPAAITLAVYAALSGLTWAQRLIGERLPGRRRGMALNLARRAGPPVAGGVILFGAGTALGLTGHGPLAALIIAGALAWGFQRGLMDVRQADWRSTGFRMMVTLGLTLAILWQTGLA